MAAIANDRDVLLQAAATRDTDPAAGKALVLSAASPVFRLDAAGAGTPGAISLAVQLVNIKAPVSWAVTGASGLVVAQNNLSANLRYIDLTAETATVTATAVYGGVTFQQSQTIQVVKDGLAGRTTALVYAYKRAASLPTDSPGAVTVDFATASITSPAGDALANGWAKTIPSGPNPLYAKVTSAVGPGTTDVIAANEWAGAVQIAQNGAPGTPGGNGMNVATVFIYQRSSSATAPALPTGYAIYVFSTGSLSGLDNGWGATVPTSGGKYLHVSQATAASGDGSDVIFPSEWAAASLMAQDGAPGAPGAPGLPGAAGVRGSRFFYLPGYSSWNDTAATNAASIGGGPVLNDAVTEYNQSAGFSQMRVWSGSSWDIVTQVIDGGLLVTGTVSANSLVANSFTGYLFTGATFRTAASGQRVLIDGSTNSMKAYASDGSLIAEIGGTASGGGFVSAFTGASSTAAVTARSSSNYAAVEGYNSNASWGTGVYGAASGSSGNGVLGICNGSGGAGGRFSGVTALSLNGRVSMDALSGGAGTAAMNAVVPVTNNTFTCGAAGYAWSGMYSQTALNVTSDRREKTDIEDSDLGLDFILRLAARRYKLLVGQQEVLNQEQEGPWLPRQEPVLSATLVERPGTRWHYGLVADEVRDALGGIDAAIWCLADANDPQSRQSLRYEELIAPLIKSIHQLHQRIEQLESR